MPAFLLNTLKIQMFKTIKFLLEGILPIQLSRANHLASIEYFSKFNNLDDALKDTRWLEARLLDNFHTYVEGGKHALRSVELFRDDGDGSSADAYADFDDLKIVFTKEFAKFELKFLYTKSTFNSSELREFIETVNHEMVHFVQFIGGAFQHTSGKRDNQTISKSNNVWYDDNENGMYEFHTMTTNEIQAWAVQVATGAINEFVDKYGENWEHKFESFRDFYNHVMSSEVVKRKMLFSRLDNKRFSTKDPAEKRALKILHKWFLKTLQDFYYDGDDRQLEYESNIEKGEKKRYLKFVKNQNRYNDED